MLAGSIKQNQIYLRILTFGAVRFFAWLVCEFPDVGTSLLQILKPGLQMVK